MAKSAVETGAFILFEIEEGIFRLTGRSLALAEKGKLLPVGEFFKYQGRFGKLDEDTLSRIQEQVNNRWRKAVERHNSNE